MPCERNNLSRDNLLNSSDNLTSSNDHDENDGGGGVRRKIDTSDVVILLDKSQHLTPSPRDTITFETEKKQHHSPSSKTPLLYAKKNVQSYQVEQFQQKNSSDFDGFYNIPSEVIGKLDEIDEFISKSNNTSINPFFNSTTEEFNTIKEKDDVSEIESSINDNSEKYQILEEETDGEEILKVDDSPAIKSHRESSDYSVSEDKSVEEALRALDIAIGFDDEDESEEEPDKLNEIKEEATFLVESVVNDAEKIIEEKQLDFNDFLDGKIHNMSTPCTITTTKVTSSKIDPDVAKVLFPGGVDLCEDDATFPISPNNETYEVVNDKTFEIQPPMIKIEREKDDVSSEEMTTVTPVNTPIELSYSSDTWDKISYNKQEPQPSTSKDEPITFNHDGWYLHPQKNDTFDIYCDDEENDGDGGNMEDMTSTFDQLRRQLTEMLPHAQGMSVHNDFLDDDESDLNNKDSNSPSDMKYGDVDEASNAASFDLLSSLLNPEPVTELNINYNNYKRPLSPILEESECDETCRTFVLNETKLMDSTSTGVLESASAGDAAVMGQMPKTLMASNDTLFNFEDTLSDHTDNLLMSPRIHTAGSSTSSTLSRHESYDRISNERTPTNEELPKIIGEIDAINIMKNNIRQHPLSLDLNSPVDVEGEKIFLFYLIFCVSLSILCNVFLHFKFKFFLVTIKDQSCVCKSHHKRDNKLFFHFTVPSKYELSKLALEDGSWPLELPEAQQIVNDLSSPEQNRTADSLSFEQDITFTIDDQKTCISLVLKNDEERISEISEPLFVSESLDAFADDANSLQIDDAISLDMDDNFNCNIVNDENGNQDQQTKDIEIHLNETSSVNYDNDSINPSIVDLRFDVDSLEPEAKILNGENFNS